MRWITKSPAGKLAGQRRAEGAGETPGHLVDLFGADDQWRQEAHHAAVAAAQFEDQAAPQALALDPRGQGAVGRRMTEGIRLALRVDDLDPEHQPPTADIAQLRIVALEDAQVLGQALAHGRRVGRQVVFLQVAHHRRTGVEQIFRAGFKEFSRLRQQPGVDPDAVMEGVARAMRVAISREEEKLEASLPFLATVGSTSPYVGLFGTVWGIMNSFRGLATVQQATLATVAPGIAEALIATAIGLFAAIPAVIAYNRFSARSEMLIGRYYTFADEFQAILHRKVHTSDD